MAKDAEMPCDTLDVALCVQRPIVLTAEQGTRCSGQACQTSSIEIETHASQEPARCPEENGIFALCRGHGRGRVSPSVGGCGSAQLYIADQAYQVGSICPN